MLGSYFSVVYSGMLRRWGCRDALVLPLSALWRDVAVCDVLGHRCVVLLSFSRVYGSFQRCDVTRLRDTLR